VTRALVALVMLVSSLASAAPPRGAAKRAFDKGIAAFEKKDYPAAAAALEQAYALHPDPEILFAWAQAARLAGDCKAAVGLYRQFLDVRPTGVQADAARLPLARCEQELGPPVPAQPLPPAAEPHPVVRAERRPFYLDPLGDALVVGGVVLLGVGIGLHVAGSGAASDAREAPTYDDALAARDRAGTRRTWGTVTLAVGAGLLGVGVWRWISVSKSDRVTVIPTEGGAVVSWGGRF
jgi:tetratricopeptide (TPR) repeat protein